MKYGGSFAKGFAGGISQGWGMGQQVLQWKERKAAQKKIDDSAAEFKANSMELARRYDADRADGTITQEEYSDSVSWAIPLGNELSDRLDKLYKNFRGLTREQIDMELEDIDAFYNLSKDLDFSNMEQMRTFGTNLKQQKAKTQWDSILKSVEGRRAEPTVELEKYPTLAEFQEKYGEEAPYEYDKEGFIRPKYKAPVSPAAMTDYQRKRANIQASTTLSKEEKDRGIYKLDTGLDIRKNDTESDFTTTEGKRTADFGLTQMFGYTTPDGIKIAGIVPARLATQLSLGRKATEAEKEAVMFDWNARKAVTQKMGGKMAVEYIEGILNQLFGEIRPEEVVPESALDKARKYIEKTFGGEEAPTEGVPTVTPKVPTVPAYGKEAMIPTMSKEELKKALETTDPSDPLYEALYNEAVKKGYITP